MLRKQNPNLQILESTVAALGPLADEFVFLGGCATGLLITDPAAPPIRQFRGQFTYLGLSKLSPEFLSGNSQRDGICRKARLSF